jgi:uncharacterized protein YbjQ (UPF0145 family)
MTNLQILTKKEAELFNQAPVFSGEDRKKHFRLANIINTQLRTFTAPHVQIGFLIHLGYFRATVRARHIGKDILAGLKNLVGGELQEYTKLMGESREQAVDRMVASAGAIGANAIINVRFTTSYIMNNASEILAYGDAVVLEREG